MTLLWLAARLASSGGRLRAALVVAGTAAGTGVLLLAAGAVAAVPGPLDPDERRLLAVVVLVLALPVVALVAAVTRLSAAVRDRRLAALRLLGVGAGATRTVAALEALLLAGAGVLLGAVAFLPVRGPLAALDEGWRGWLRGSGLAPGAGGWALATLGVLVVAGAVALAPGATGTASALRVRRQGATARPSLLRLLPLAAGSALLAWVALRPLDPQAALPPGTVPAFLVGTALAGAGLPLAAPVGVRLLADAAARWAPTPAVQLAGRRAQQEPAAATRLVAVLLVGLFLVAGARSVLVAVEGVPQAVRAERALTTGPRDASLQAQDGIPLTGADLEALRAVPGVRAVAVLRTARLDCGAFVRAVPEGEAPPPCGGEALVAACDDLPALQLDVSACVDGRPFWVIDAFGEWREPGRPLLSDLPPTLVALDEQWQPDPAVPPLRLPLVTTRLRASQDPTDPNWGRDGTWLVLPPGTPGIGPYLQPPSYEAVLDGGEEPLAALRAAAAARGVQTFAFGDEEEYARLVAYRDLVWALAAVVLGLGLLALLVTGVDRAVERRRQVAALVVVGVPLRVLRRTQLLQVAAPLVLGLPLAAGVGLLAGAAYLGLDGERGGLPAAPVGLVTALALAVGLVVAAATVAGLGRAPSAADLRRE